MKKYTIFLFLFYNFLAAQTFNVQLHISTKEKLVEVVVENTNLEEELKDYSFVNQIPNFNQELYPTDYVKHILVEYNNKSEKKEHILGEYALKLNPKFILKKISYKVTENFGYNTFAPTSNYINDNLILLNLSYILGFFEDGSSTHYKISYSIDSLEHLTELGLKMHLEWIETPLIIKPENSFNLSEYFPLSAYSNSLPISEAAFLDFLGRTLYATHFFHKSGEKELVFIFDTLKVASASIVHSNKAVLYFNTNTFNDESGRINFQSKVIQTMFDWWIPFKEPKSDPSKTWMVEGGRAYLSYKYMLKNKLITEIQFLKILAEKIEVSKEFKDISLPKLSLEASNNNSYRESFYNKGVLYCWYFDYLIIKNSVFDFEKILMGKFKFNSDEDVLKLNEVLADFEKIYVEQNKSIELNNFLNFWGLEINESNQQEIKVIMFKENLSLEQKENWKRYAN